MSDDYVTQREFARLERTVNETSRDVKTLLAAHYAEQGAEEERHMLIEATRDKGARKIAWVSLTATFMGSLYWVSTALAKLVNHPHH